MAKKMTAYEALGLRPDASAQQIRLAFHKLAKTYHPDVNDGDLQSERTFRKISAAHDILKHPERRAAYDAYLKLVRQAVARRRMKNIAGYVLSAASSFCIVSGGLLLLLTWLGTVPAIVERSQHIRLSAPFESKSFLELPSATTSGNSADIAPEQTPQFQPSVYSNSKGDRRLWRIQQTTPPMEVLRSAEYADRAEWSGREHESTEVLARVLAHTVAPNADAGEAGQQERSRSRGSHSMHPRVSVGKVDMQAGGHRPAIPPSAGASPTKPSKATVRARSRVKHARPRTIRRHAVRVFTVTRNEPRSVASSRNERARIPSSQLHRKQRPLKRKAHRRPRHEQHRVPASVASQHGARPVHVRGRFEFPTPLLARATRQMRAGVPIIGDCNTCHGRSHGAKAVAEQLSTMD